jgi:hypothetical protein
MYLIILTSDEPWGDVWMPQLVYAYELSKKYDVIYINPPARWSIKNLFSKGKPSFRYNDNLIIFQYHNIFPVRIFSNFIIQMNDFFNSLRLKKETRKQNKKVITWRFDTHRFRKFTGIPAFKSIYHVIDPYMTVENDKTMAKEADLVISTSPKYEEHYRRFNKNVLVIPHGVTLEEQAPDAEKVNELKKEYGSYFLCLGSISSHTNMDILERVSQEFPGNIILVVGPVKAHDSETTTRFYEFIKNKNVKYTGPRHGLELKNYVAASAVCIVPYVDLAALNTNRSPMRILSYIAQYKPVINTVDSEIPELENKIIYTSMDPQKFCDFIKKALAGELVVDKKAVDAYMNKIEYSGLIDNIMNKLLN